MAALSKLGWYWHRLRAMSPQEVLLRFQKRAYQIADKKYEAPAGVVLEANGKFPRLPEKRSAPQELLDSLRLETEEILRGNWKAFGHLPLRLSDPPAWHADNLVNKDLRSSEIAFKLDHRAQPDGADIKVIWEPNRWYQLVRLAMAAWLLDHVKAQEKCIEWLHDWARTNPPFTGLNWTSGLETGIRLIQFTWIDSFLTAAGVPHKTLEELRGCILPPHVWYTWRYKSFGSSANNHLIGELAGVVVALARWPDLSKYSAPISAVGPLMEREIIAQFAKDGGNQEQALGYHLFSWEFCFQAQRALESVGISISAEANERLIRAGEFYRKAKLENDNWDFGDSDNAWVTPLFASETKAAQEWWRWFDNSQKSPALQFWWGNFPAPAASKETQWEVFPESGYAVLRAGDWFARFEFSPLGYLSMAPHGHLDALHLSVCYRGRPVIVDPGTGAYYADKAVRNYLADWAAHNSPHLKNPPADYPKRRGTFLWGEHHAVPNVERLTPMKITARLKLPYGSASRSVEFLPDRNAIRVQDSFSHSGVQSPIVTRWKFAPEFKIERVASNGFRVSSADQSIQLQPGPTWKMNRTYNPPDELRGRLAPTTSAFANIPLESFVSPAFRALTPASYLALESDEHGPLELIISPG